jgi:OOP family OmpA-OmpF porin
VARLLLNPAASGINPVKGKGEEEMNATKLLLAAAVLVLSGLVAASQASAQGFYMGGSVGQSDIDSSIAVPDLITAGTFDGKDTAYKLFGGYQFNQHFGLEIAYIDLGSASYSGSFIGLPVTGGSVDVSGLNFSAVGTLPLNAGFALFGKVGLFSWEAKAHDITAGVPFSGKVDGTDISVGLGASYNITKSISVRAEWDRFELDTANADLLSIGIVFRF